VPALLTADPQVGQAHVDEGLTRELVLGAFDLLQAQDVRGVLGDETGDLINAQADRVDVPGDDAKAHASGLSSLAGRGLRRLSRALKKRPERSPGA